MNWNWEVKHLTETMYHLLYSYHSGISNRSDRWLIYNRKEAELIKEKCTCFHNCELHYLTRGLMAVDYEESLNISALESHLHRPLFKRKRNMEVCEGIKKDETKLRNQENANL